MRKIISLICLLLPVMTFVAGSPVFADELVIHPDSSSDIRSDAPDRHVVVKGDTMWDISGKFFNDPWKWPHIWGINKDTIKDPHWIYPGDVIILDRNNGTLQVAQPVTPPSPDVPPAVAGDVKEQASASTAAVAADKGNTLKLSPEVRKEASAHDAIPSIPASAIEPFLSLPLVIEEDALKDAPELIGTRQNHVVFGSGDTGFAKGLPTGQGDKWQVYRPGKTFIDPDTKEELGVEAIYLGDAEVTRFADVSTVAITRSVQEIRAGDRLAIPTDDDAKTYLPRAPENKISASVISIYNGVSQGGQNMVITLNKGARDGLERGHVLALYHKGEVIKRPAKSFFSWSQSYKLPDERYGLVFVFRVFNKVSYALVMQTKRPVVLLDHADTP